MCRPDWGGWEVNSRRFGWFCVVLINKIGLQTDNRARSNQLGGSDYPDNGLNTVVAIAAAADK